MKKAVAYLSLTLLASCSGDMKSTLGLRKSSPDKFTVISKPHLSVPPVLYLHDNTSGDKVPFQNQVGQDSKTLTKAEKSFLGNFSTTDSDPHIKSQLEAERHAKLEQNREKGSIRRLFDKMKGETKDKIIEPVEERERIQKNISEGKPINEGDIPEKNVSKSPFQKLME